MPNNPSFQVSNISFHQLQAIAMNVEQQLTKALQAQFENDNADENRLREINDQVKHSIIHQHNWEELLHPMPVLIQSIAACFAAARCDMTHGYGPNQPVGKFESLTSVS
jgi:hypothetical protein